MLTTPGTRFHSILHSKSSNGMHLCSPLWMARPCIVQLTTLRGSCEKVASGDCDGTHDKAQEKKIRRRVKISERAAFSEVDCGVWSFPHRGIYLLCCLLLSDNLVFVAVCWPVEGCHRIKLLIADWGNVE